MHLYRGLSRNFIEDSQNGEIAEKLSNSFMRHFRYRPSDNEVRSWHNSLGELSRVLAHGDLEEQGVVVEYRLPLSSKRLDVLLTGHGKSGQPNGVVVELKQWEQVQASPIDECVATFVGGRVRDTLHPSVQADSYRSYLLDMYSTFSEEHLGLTACAFLHNLSSESEPAIFDVKFDQFISSSPSFVKRQAVDEFLAHLDQLVGEGGGAETLRALLDGKERPHKKLLDHVADTIEQEPAFVLLDEQRVAFNEVLQSVRDGAPDEKAIILVHGGPGTGKSLIALHLLAAMSREDLVTYHATGSKAFTETLRKQVGARAGALFKYFNSFMEPGASADLIICDEAHRLRKTSNNQYTSAAKRSNKEQIREIVDATRVSVFLIDDRQAVRPDEVGSSDLIKTTAESLGIPIKEHFLEAQFRCNGSDAFVKWVANTLEVERTPHVLWDSSDGFELNIVDSPDDLENDIRSRVEAGSSGRLVAGFCWPWSDPDRSGNLVADVKVGSWQRPWNARPNAGRLAPGIPKASFWASDPGGIEQVGCVYTAQGFEFDYVGIVWGKDLVYRPGTGWVGQREHSCDTSVKRGAKSDPARFLRLVKNTYRVLLTRGLRGCSVYFEDDATRDFVLSRMESNDHDD